MAFNLFGFGQQQSQMLSPIPTRDNQPAGNSSGNLFQGPVLPKQNVDQFRLTGRDQLPARSGSVLGATTGGISGGSSSRSSSSSSSSSQQITNPYENLQPQGVSDAELNAIYDPSNQYLDQAESNLRGQLPGLISEAEAQAAAQKSMLGDKRASAFGQLQQSEQSAQTVKSNQEAQQRQLLQELGQANQQRFGGASSAGEAASEIQGREFQRNLGGIGQNFQQAYQQIQQKKVDVDNEYNTGLQQLQANTQAAVNDINRRFQDKLLEISRLRSENAAAKAQARLGALQELRNAIFQINVQKAEFQSALDQQRQQNLAGLSQAESQFSQFVTGGQGAASQFGNTQAGGITGVSSGAQQGPQQLTGQIASRRAGESDAEAFARQKAQLGIG